MRHLFSLEGAAALAANMARRPLLAFDFDGTLAPMVAEPDAARVPQPVAWRLEMLARRLPVAVITGRSVADVRQRLPFTPHYVIGNHGAEGDGATPPERVAQAFCGLRRHLREHLAALNHAGVMVEDKQQSIALHYRQALDPESARSLAMHTLRGATQELVVSQGKMVVNVTAAAAPDKAQAIAWLLQRSGAQGALFAGDDINDEPVFARPEPAWLSVRVGRDPPQTQAMFHLNHCTEVPAMLDRMLMLSDRRRQH